MVVRQPLRDISDHSHSNTVRLVQNTPPRLLTTQQQQSVVEERRYLFDQPLSHVLPTQPSQVLPPPSNSTATPLQGSALPYTHDAVSPFDRTTNAQPETATYSSASIHAVTHQETSNIRQRPKTPRSSKLKHVAVRADKTFSVLDLAQVDSSQYPSDWKTPTRRPSFPASRTPDERLSSHLTENDSPTKSLASYTQPSTSAVAPKIHTLATPTQTRKQPTAERVTTPPAPPTSFDTNHSEPFGGIRIVPKTPESKKAVESPAPRTPEAVPPLPSAPATPINQILTTRSSNLSAAVSENPSEIDNYVVYHHDNSSSESASSTIIRHPIHATSSIVSGDYQERPRTSPCSSIFGPAESHNSNYEPHGDPEDESQADKSPEPTSPEAESVAAPFLTLVPRPAQDSLTVLPLRPNTRRSHDQFGYYKSRSRDSLRTATSLASISSILTQEATRAVFNSGAVVQIGFPPSSFAIPGSWAEQALSRQNHMQAHPHQWSSQLSTVHSESDVASNRGTGNLSSRNLSSAGRRSSGHMSFQSRLHRGSGGSSVRADQRSSLNSLERPQPAFMRFGQREGTGSAGSMVGDQDEHGDHLTDMPDLRSRPSRSRSGLSLSFFSTSSSDNLRNSVQSAGSSRANSLLVNTIPTWAKLYYGSGERRWLAAGAPGSSTEGSFVSPPDSPATRSGSPNTDNFPLAIYSPRRRPREAHPNRKPTSPLRRSLEIVRNPRAGDQGNEDARGASYARQSRRWRTSSIWSPHLRKDRRATRMSVWAPPSFNWSTEDSWSGRRNIQVVMFVIGFIFPFAWMTAAFLPLPQNPVFGTQERQDGHFDVEWSPSHPDLTNASAHDFRLVDEARYESAKWWRRLNRCMSFVGILIIGAVVALIVLGLQDWGKS